MIEVCLTVLVIMNIWLIYEVLTLKRSFIKFGRIRIKMDKTSIKLFNDFKNAIGDIEDKITSLKNKQEMAQKGEDSDVLRQAD